MRTNRAYPARIFLTSYIITDFDEKWKMANFRKSGLRIGDIAQKCQQIGLSAIFEAENVTVFYPLPFRSCLIGRYLCGFSGCLKSCCLAAFKAVLTAVLTAVLKTAFRASIRASLRTSIKGSLRLPSVLPSVQLSAAPGASLFIGVEDHSQRDPAASGVDSYHLDLHALTHAHHLERMPHVPAREL